MTDSPAPRLIIGLTAAPHKRDDGYMYQPHDTQPSPELIERCHWLASEVIRRLDWLAPNLLRLEFSFKRKQTPGELTLIMELDLTGPAGDTISMSRDYSYISTEHMRTDEALQDHFLVRFWEDLAREVRHAATLQRDASQELEKWLDVTGQPNYGTDF